MNLHPIWLVSSEEGKMDTETYAHKEKMMWRHTEDDQVTGAVQAKEYQGQPEGRQIRKDSPLEPSESMVLPTLWFQTSHLQTWEIINFYCSVCGTLLQQH